MYLVRLNPLGDIEWEARYIDTNSETTKALAVAAASDGGFIAVGYTYDHDSSRDDIYMIKVDSGGVELWDDFLGIDTEFDHAQGVIEDSDGNYVITGFTRIGTGSDYSFVWKKSPSGANVGSIHILNGGASRCNQNDLVQIGSSYYLAGWSASGDGYANLMKVSTDTSLSSAAFFGWERTYDGPGYTDSAQAVVVTPEGGLLLAGVTDGGASSPGDVYVVKTNAAGTVLWTMTVDKGGNDGAMDVF